jgi:predicted nucleic acid-binding protein
MKWLLDTNIVSETIRPNPNRTVIEWIAKQPREHLAVSIVTIAELRMGAETVAEPKRGELVQWLDTMVMPSFAERTLALTTEVLVDWLQLSRKFASKRLTREASDLLIAATARIHDLIVVTRNVRDFADTGVIVYDPWASKTQHMEEQ